MSWSAPGRAAENPEKPLGGISGRDIVRLWRIHQPSVVTTVDLNDVVKELKELRYAISRLEATVRTKIATPVASLTTQEAAEILRCSVTTVRRYQDRGVFTDARAGRKSGSPWRLLSDEVDVLRIEGEEALQEFRRSMGRL